MQFLIDIGLSLLYFCIFLLFCAWSWRFWKMYVNQKYLASIDWVMLEIKLPREIFKSPMATEIAISAFLQSSGASTKYARNYEGKLAYFGSLEIASIEGVIHFYIRVQRRFRALMESNFYAQYPGVEIVEADDYTKLIHYHHLSKDTSGWGLNYKPTKTWEPHNLKTGKPYEDEEGKPYKMKADFIPIKTYVDYGLDKDPKEEFKIDPITPLLEAMSTLGKGEHMWYQVLVQDESVYDDKKFQNFYLNKKSHEHWSLTDMAKRYKQQIRTSGYTIQGTKSVDEFGVAKKMDGPVDSEGKPTKIDALYLETKPVMKEEVKLTQDEKDELESINKKLSKPLAVVVVRIMYVTKKENFNIGHTGTTINFMKGFSGANKFGPNRITDPYDYPWERYGGKRVAWRTEELFESYVEREGFYPHIKERKALDKWEDLFFWASSMKQRKLFRLVYEVIFHPFDHPHAEDEAFTANLEEIATLWHLPGAVAGTPMLPRIDSMKGVAPVNLPL
jgi:hypothetical protein